MKYLTAIQEENLSWNHVKSQQFMGYKDGDLDWKHYDYLPETGIEVLAINNKDQYVICELYADVDAPITKIPNDRDILDFIISKTNKHKKRSKIIVIGASSFINKLNDSIAEKAQTISNLVPNKSIFLNGVELEVLINNTANDNHCKIVLNDDKNPSIIEKYWFAGGRRVDLCDILCWTEMPLAPNWLRDRTIKNRILDCKPEVIITHNKD